MKVTFNENRLVEFNNRFKYVKGYLYSKSDNMQYQGPRGDFLFLNAGDSFTASILNQMKSLGKVDIEMTPQEVETIIWHNIGTLNLHPPIPVNGFVKKNGRCYTHIYWLGPLGWGQSGTIHKKGADIYNLWVKQHDSDHVMFPMRDKNLFYGEDIDPETSFETPSSLIWYLKDRQLVVLPSNAQYLFLDPGASERDLEFVKMCRLSIHDEVIHYFDTEWVLSRMSTYQEGVQKFKHYQYLYYLGTLFNIKGAKQVQNQGKLQTIELQEPVQKSEHVNMFSTLIQYKMFSDLLKSL